MTFSHAAIMLAPIAWLSCLLFNVPVAFAGNAEVWLRIEGDGDALHLGNSVASVGDVNADGIPDFAVSGTQGDDGIVRVFSGADGSELYTITSVFPNTPYGEDRNLTAIGDLDGDGVSEIAIGTPWGNELEPLGFFDIHSGADGANLTTHRGQRFESLSNEIAHLGDVDGDGISDYAASTFERGDEGGYVAIYSGDEQNEIGRLLTKDPVWLWSIAGPGDLNGDGLADIAIGMWGGGEPWSSGQVRVLSGAIFTDQRFISPTVNIDSAGTLEFILWTVDGKRGEDVHHDIEVLGQGLNALGDIDGDGVPDLGVGTGLLDDAIVLSGADGSRLHEWTSDKLLFDQHVVETETIGDANGDGVPDIVVGRRGSLTLHSGKDGEILATMTGDGGFGKEIAAVGDLNGDGLSEILAGAPEGGYALVVSFGEEPESKPELGIRYQDGAVTLSWLAKDAGWALEQSTDLRTWTAVEEILRANPTTFSVDQLVPQSYFRLRQAIAPDR